MRVIAIDARAAARPELGGVERWARELSARLPALGDYQSCTRHARSRTARATRGSRPSCRCARGTPAALLCPANLAPVAFPRTVVVLHDAAVLRHPGWYSRAYAAWQRRLLPLLARRALRVITVSEFSRAELPELLGLDPGRVRVVPGGVDPAFSPAADADRARAALGLARPYVLCVASHTARKNLAALAPAARALAAEGVDVVVAGGHRPQFAAEADLEALRVLGHVSDPLLPGLYAGAEAFVLPSRYEGFGLPVLEAMAAGTPVVAADAGALPETCGGAARLVPPDGEAVRDALLALLGDADERARLRAAGRAGRGLRLGRDGACGGRRRARGRGLGAAARVGRLAAALEPARRAAEDGERRRRRPRRPHCRRSPDQSNGFGPASLESHVYQSTARCSGACAPSRAAGAPGRAAAPAPRSVTSIPIPRPARRDPARPARTAR